MMQSESDHDSYTEDTLDELDGPDSRRGQQSFGINHPSHSATSAASMASEIVVQMQKAIRQGQARSAMEFAKLLTGMRPLLRARLESSYDINDEEQEISIHAYVCNRDCTSDERITIQVRPTMTVETLKSVVFLKHGFLPELQKWVVGKRLVRDNEVLTECGIDFDGAVVFLYLLTPRHLNASEFQSRDSLIRTSSLGETSQRSDAQVAASTPLVPSASCGSEIVSEPPSSPTSCGSLPQQTETGGWQCFTCTYLNKSNRDDCEMCATARPTTNQVTRNQLEGMLRGTGVQSRASDNYDVVDELEPAWV